MGVSVWLEMSRMQRRQSPEPRQAQCSNTAREAEGAFHGDPSGRVVLEKKSTNEKSVVVVRRVLEPLNGL